METSESSDLYFEDFLGKLLSTRWRGINGNTEARPPLFWQRIVFSPLAGEELMETPKISYPRRNRRTSLHSLERN